MKLRGKKSKFIYLGYDAKLERGIVNFNYRLEAQGVTFDFKETIFLLAKTISSKVPEHLSDILWKNIMLALGISYWKTYCPRNIEIKNNWLTEKQAQFWNTLYTKGLGEFFYKNKIEFRDLINFPYVDNIYVDKNQEIANLNQQNKSLLLLGGGKDSLVSAEILKKQKKPYATLTIGDYPLQNEINKILRSDSLIIRREIDPKLLELNQQKGIYNGHIPISSIYAFLGLVAAILYDYKHIIASNEKSANYGNIVYRGETINHQWSKSYEFENMFQEYVRRFITPDIKYYSILRPYSEIKIVEIFSKYPKYFPVFSSCNTNFSITKKYDKKWCGKCAKCAFVFSSLAAYLPKSEVLKIFSKNLFEDKTLLPLYKELAGIKKFKPFECVGTAEETRLAFSKIYKKAEFNNDIIIKSMHKYFSHSQTAKKTIQIKRGRVLFV